MDLAQQVDEAFLLRVREVLVAGEEVAHRHAVEQVAKVFFDDATAPSVTLSGATALFNGVLDLGDGGDGGYAAAWAREGTQPADNGTANATGGNGGSSGSASVPSGFTLVGLSASGHLINGVGGTGGEGQAVDLDTDPNGQPAWGYGSDGCNAGDRNSPYAARGWTACSGGSATAEGGPGGAGLTGGRGGSAFADGGDGGSGGRGVNSGAALYGTDCVLYSSTSTNCPGAAGGPGGYGGNGGSATARGGNGGLGVLNGGRGGDATSYGGTGGRGGNGGRGGGMAVWDQTAFTTELFFCVVDAVQSQMDGCVEFLISLPTYDNLVCGAGGYQGQGGYGGWTSTTVGSGGAGGLSKGGSGTGSANAGGQGAWGDRGANGQYWNGGYYDMCASASFPW